MFGGDIETARSSSRLSRILQRILPAPILTVQGRTRLQADINQDLEIAEVQHPEEEFIDGEMPDDNEHVENKMMMYN